MAFCAVHHHAQDHPLHTQYVPKMAQNEKIYKINGYTPLNCGSVKKANIYYTSICSVRMRKRVSCSLFGTYSGMLMFVCTFVRLFVHLFNGYTYFHRSLLRVFIRIANTHTRSKKTGKLITWCFILLQMCACACACMPVSVASPRVYGWLFATSTTFIMCKVKERATYANSVHTMIDAQPIWISVEHLHAS